MSISPLLEAKNLTCIRNERILFRGLSFELHAGMVLQIVGANGSGKSSLLNILSGLTPAERGVVRWKSQNVAYCRTEFLTELVYIGHQHGFKSNLTVYENLHFAAVLAGYVHNISIMQALAEVGLTNLEHVLFDNLSAGQQRRAVLAKLLLLRASLWLLDEPLTALDKQAVILVEQLLTNHIRRGGIAVLSSHQVLNLTDITLQEIHLTPKQTTAVLKS